MNLDKSLSWEQVEEYERFIDSDDLPDDENEEVFKKYSDLIIFAACLGFEKGERKEDYGGDGAIRMSSVLSSDLRKVMSQALAYADTEEMESINDIETQADVVGGYALSGIKKFDEEVGQTGELLDAVVEYLREHRDEDEEERRKGVLEEIEKQFE